MAMVPRFCFAGLVVVAFVGGVGGCSATGGGRALSDVERWRVYIGTYTNGASEGIYSSELDLATGELTSPRLAGQAVNPSFVALHPSRPLLYAVGEIADFAGGDTGAVSAFAIDPATGQLSALNQQSSKGAGPCYLVVDATGGSVLVANYGSGSVASLPIGSDGSLGEAASAIQHTGSSITPGRQAGPHAHSINLDAANRFAVAADLGLDKMLVYRFDAERSTLTANDPPSTSVSPGGGPRHFSFHPSGRFAYMNNEITSAVTAFAYSADRGVLTELQTLSTLPAGFDGNNSTAEVQVHPSGRFLYCSNRGHNSLAIYTIDTQTGRLTHVGNESTGGRTPRNFGIDPTGRYILAANQASDSVVVFRVNQKTGQLTPTGHTISVPTPRLHKVRGHRFVIP